MSRRPNGPRRPGKLPRSNARLPRVEVLEGRRLMATFTVDNINDSGPGSLRQAIVGANAMLGTDLIDFAIGTGPQTIALGSALSDITSPVVIDGTTQPGPAGTPLITLDGSAAGVGANGLRIAPTGGGSAIRGLVIRGFGREGIFLDDSSNNTVGGTAPGAGNVISGNNDQGITINGGSAQGNLVQGNRIGTTADGSADLGNALAGIRITNGATLNTIGGTATGAGNVISGNGLNGITILAPANLVQGNLIGTNVTGTAALGNDSRGVLLLGPDNTVGGTATGAGNLISGNGLGIGIAGVTTTRNLVAGNLIGTNAAGTAALGNTGDGIEVFNAPGNTIGGTAPGARNVISGNGAIGIDIAGSAANNVVSGNSIGTNAAGNRGLSNLSGVNITDAPDNTVGGTATGAGNLISGNLQDGVALFFAGATRNLVQGNFIGTDVAGTAALANDFGLPGGNVVNGVHIFGGASNNTIGGVAPGARNLISGNGDFFLGNGIAGVLIEGVVLLGNLVQGNYIGTDDSGTGFVPNRNGVVISFATSTTIGGSAAGAGNLISGNAFGTGVRIDAPGGSSGTVVQGNRIGTDVFGTGSLPNSSGVGIDASDNTIGGTTPGAGNIIAFNAATSTGIFVGGGTRNAILSNSIFGNDGLGINLSGPVFPPGTGITPNDAGDVDTGPNDLQNYPVLTTASTAPGVTTITGTLNSESNTLYTVQFFASALADPTGFGEGQQFLGQVSVMTDGIGNIDFTESIATGPLVGNFITATATDPAGNTSEFSGGTVAISGLSTTVINTNDSGPGSLRQAILNANAVPGTDTIDFAIPGTGPFTIAPTSALPPITADVTIDAATQAGFAGTPIVEVSGQNLVGPGIAGLTISGGGATVRGLVINRFPGSGIVLGTSSGGSRIVGNSIGTDVAGTAGLGNAQAGVLIDDSPDNLIGGTTAADRNIISDNGANGLTILGSGSMNNLVVGNFIGVDATGSGALGNGGSGVFSDDGATTNTTIGGNVSGAGNTIAFNGGSGVVVLSGTAKVILSNSIFSNGGLGIDLGNNAATPNDANDPDLGPNSLQNFPILTGVTVGAGTTTLTGTLNSTPGRTFLVQIFGSDCADPSGFGEGRRFLGETMVTTDGSGNAPINFAADGTALGPLFTATATDVGSRNTSEFGPSLEIPSLVVTGTGDTIAGDGVTTLREAITFANSLPGIDTITFQILGSGVQTIAPLTALPDITDPVVIDGYTQTGASVNTLPDGDNAVLRVELSGANLTGSGSGLTITAGGSTVRGLVINRFRNNGIVLTTGGGNIVQGNFIGTDDGGTADLGNSFIGVAIDSAGNTVGGTSPAARNLISGNDEEGVRLAGAGATRNVVAGNLVGTDLSGSLPLGNNGIGVLIQSGAAGNTVGGAVAAARNVISSNVGAGVAVSGAGSSGNVIQGNYIGTDATGIFDLGNVQEGVSIGGASGNTIGGPAAGQRNILSGNGEVGIEILRAGATGNLVQGNYIGTDVTGTVALGNDLFGVEIHFDASDNTVGGTTAAARNIISGNAQIGVILSEGGTGNLVQGNFIGTDFTGTANLGNAGSGILIVSGATGNTVGGTGGAGSNTIAFNGGGFVVMGGIQTTNFSGTNTNLQPTIVNSGTLQIIAPDAIPDTSAVTIDPGAALVLNDFPQTIGSLSGGGAVTLGSGTLTTGGDNSSTGFAGVISGSGGLTKQGSGTFTLSGPNTYTGTTLVGAGALVLGASNVLSDSSSVIVAGGTLDIASNDDSVLAVTLIGGSINSTSTFTFTGTLSSSTAFDLQSGSVGARLGGSAGLIKSTGGTVTLTGSNTYTGTTVVQAGTLNLAAAGGNSVPGDLAIGDTAGGFGADVVRLLADNQVADTATVTVTASGQLDLNGFADTFALLLETVANTNDTGPASLRDAITTSNRSGGPAQIRFAIAGAGPFTISPTSALPAISDPVVIDGYTQAGASPNSLPDGNNAVLRIELSGTAAGSPVPGLMITAGGSTVRGLVINRFGASGIVLTGGGGNTVQGNFIGVDTTGTVAPGNGSEGVFLIGSADNTIGGTAAADRNVIAGNRRGVQILNGASTGNLVLGNRIGTDASGTVGLGNLLTGVSIFAATGNTIGGTAPGARNVISGSGGSGVEIANAGAAGNLVQGNYIGADISGTADLGNVINGVNLHLGASGNTIGGTVPGAGNVISGNDGQGVRIVDGTTAANAIQGNFIGTDATGTVPLGNGRGVFIDANASSNAIGGTAAIAGNVIAFNAGAGVAVNSGVGNALLSNTIFANAGLGIDLGGGGVTPNDPRDGDAGPNNLQNFPVLDRAVSDAETTSIDGTLNSTPNITFRIEFFADSADPSGFGEGRTSLGATTVTTDTAGNASFSVSLPAGVPPGQRVTATATDPAGNTSEFSAAIPTGIRFTVVNTNDLGFGSLRQAILNANAVAGVQTIDFAIPSPGPYTIILAAALPDITDPVVIDASTQPGASPNSLAAGNNAVLLVELNGFNVPSSFSGLRILAGGSAVRGLVINRFSGVGILLASAGNVIAGNSIGTNAAGDAAAGNGIGLLVNGAGNTIGGTLPADRNVISGSTSTIAIPSGISITGAGATGNVVAGNFIGTNAAGTASLGNGFDGVVINTSGNTLGGTAAGARNVIAGNGRYGVFLSNSAAAGNLVAGNSIGTDVTGTIDLGNGSSGVFVLNAPGNTIGGTSAGASNVIAGNAEGVALFGDNSTGNLVAGNLIGTDVTGTVDLGNFVGIVIRSPRNTVGGTTAGARNVISGNDGDGILIGGSGASGNLVVGNFLGTVAAGTADLGNGGVGVAIGDAPDNTIGGTAAGAWNVISGNGGQGVLIAGVGATVNLVAGNFLGTDVTGTIDLGNTGNGIALLAGASGNTVGGAGAAARNVVSGNTLAGIALLDAGTTGNVIQGNSIGIDATGAVALGNDQEGVFLQDASGNTIGGTTPGQRNIISANLQAGIELSGGGTTGNVIQGNYLGTDAAGTSDRGNGLDGVLLSGAGGNTIGGAAAGAGNLIAGNSRSGVYLFGAGATGNRVSGNVIGLDASGSVRLGNGQDGVRLDGATGNTIGGPAPGQGNVLSGNVAGGVAQVGGASGNVVSGNLIGTGPGGASALGNGQYGVLVQGAIGNTIGGTSAAARNVISGNTGDGILVSGVATGNVVAGNFIGTNAAGTADLGNGVNGVTLSDAPGNTVGGTAAGAGNVIAGNDADGVVLLGGGATGNFVVGNLIGSNASGVAGLGNGRFGINIAGAPGNLVGGTAGGARNIIVANGLDGVRIQGVGASGNVVAGNSIGTDAIGTALLGNGFAGIFIASPGNTVGGTVAGAGNVISGNDGAGIELSGAGTTGNVIQGNTIGLNAAGTFPLGNGLSGVNILAGAAGNLIGGAGASARNILSGNALNGVLIAGAGTTGNVIQGNSIGTNSAGTAAVGNVREGVAISDTFGNTIGPGNVIAGNGQSGVLLVGAGATGNLIVGNVIGLDSTGTAPLGNGEDGVRIVGGSGNIVGGAAPGEGNVLSGNAAGGVVLVGGASGNVVLGNWIGTDRAGLRAQGNGRDGVRLQDAVGNTIGGLSAGARNVIAGNRANGLLATGTATGNVVAGNFIGTDVTATVAVGNFQEGVSLQAAGNTIGGTTPGAGNVVSGNGASGISLSGPGATGNLVTGNFIGTDGTGIADLGNRSDGVLLVDAPGNTIGGTTPGARNIISGNDGSGVDINGSGAGGNLVAGNFIGTDVTGTRTIGNDDDGVELSDAPANTIGGAAVGAGNLISGNSLHGISIAGGGATGNSVQGNSIGTDATGTVDLGNVLDGVRIDDAPGNTIGGAAPAGNTISGNLGAGIVINSAAGTLVLGNRIGTDATGSAPLGNSLDGVILLAAANNTVSDNVIAGNLLHGVRITGPTAAGNLIRHNTIGTNTGGTAAISNALDGLFLDGAPGNVLLSNTVAGNRGHGIRIAGASASGNQVRGNTIGSDDPASPRANALDGVLLDGAPGNVVTDNSIAGNARHGLQIAGGGATRVQGNFLNLNGVDGVLLLASPGNTIGGAEPGTANVITGNRAHGVEIAGAAAAGNTVAGNFIGTDPAGTVARGNALSGVLLDDAPNNLIGGAPNVISGNGAGVSIRGASATGNRVQGNFIGTSPGGTVALGNRLNGVLIDGAPGNTIGGVVAGQANVLSGNGARGLLIAGTGAAGNVVVGNVIGTDLSVTVALGNGLDGIFIAEAPANSIGGAAAGAGNRIAGNRGDGVRIMGSGATGTLVQGNTITFSGGHGVSVFGGARGLIVGNTISASALSGVLLQDAPGNTIGGGTLAARNVIGGNGQAGVFLLGGAATGNLVAGNYLGTDASGTLSRGNHEGVRLQDAPGNTIGGTAPGTGNLLSGNAGAGSFEGVAGYGVLIQGAGASRNVVQGNFIGTDVTGTVALPNFFDGILIESAAGNTIGGTTPGARNVISGNGSVGVQVYLPGAAGNVIVGNFIGTDVTGRRPLGNARNGVFLNAAPGTTVLANVISANILVGVQLGGASGSAVLGNLIGTDVSGTVALPNGSTGVFLDGRPGADGTPTITAGNTIGGPGPGARNVIASNSLVNVYLLGPGATGNLVQGNYLGTDFSGTRGLGGGYGVFIDDAANNTIGAGNVIAGNGVGLELIGEGATGNVVRGNLIGTDATGTVALGNLQDGVFVFEASGNTIGGTTAGDRNVIAGNGTSGVQLFGPVSRGNVVAGNFIGTDVTGTAALGNRQDGVFVNGAPGNTIGGAASGARNVVSANGNVGVHLFGRGATGNVVQGNFIGTDVAGTPSLGNNFGLLIEGAPGNVIGGPRAGESNVVAGNRTADVLEVSAAAGPGVQGGSVVAGGDGQVQGVVLTFTTDLDAKRAQDPRNYRVVWAGRDRRFRTRDDAAIRVRGASYDPVQRTVTLTLSRPLGPGSAFRLTVNGTPPRGLTAANGRALDGNGDGRPGGNFTTQFGSAQPAGSPRAPRQTRAARRREAPSRLSAVAVDTLLDTNSLVGRTARRPGTRSQ